jgi:hypothetical protein
MSLMTSSFLINKVSGTKEVVEMWKSNPIKNKGFKEKN